jgi:hypothetical protein
MYRAAVEREQPTVNNERISFFSSGVNFRFLMFVRLLGQKLKKENWHQVLKWQLTHVGGFLTVRCVSTLERLDQ